MKEEQMSECIWCGKKFPKVRQTKLYCSEECRKKYWDELRRSAYKKKHRNTANEDLVEVAAEARDAGMTYGQYVAKKYMEELHLCSK